MSLTANGRKITDVQVILRDGSNYPINEVVAYSTDIKRIMWCRPFKLYITFGGGGASTFENFDVYRFSSNEPSASLMTPITDGILYYGDKINVDYSVKDGWLITQEQVSPPRSSQVIESDTEIYVKTERFTPDIEFERDGKTGDGKWGLSFWFQNNYSIEIRLHPDIYFDGDFQYNEDIIVPPHDSVILNYTSPFSTGQTAYFEGMWTMFSDRFNSDIYHYERDNADYGLETTTTTTTTTESDEVYDDLETIGDWTLWQITKKGDNNVK